MINSAILGACSGGSLLRRVGTTWALEPSLFSITSSLVTAAADGARGSIVLNAASGKQPPIDVGDAAQYEIDKSKGPFTGKVGLRLSNGDTKLFSPLGGPTGNQPFHLVGIVEYMAVGGGAAGLCNYATFGAPSATGNTGVGVTPASFAVIGNGSGTFTFGAYDNLPHFIDVKYDGATLTISRNGKVAYSGPKVFAIPDASFGFMNWFGNPAYPAADVRVWSHVLVVGKTWSPIEVNEIMRHELLSGARLAGPTGHGRIIPMFGDSTVSGTALGAEPLDVALRTKQVAPNIMFPSNYGVSGEKPAEVAARLLAYTSQSTDIFTWCGRNLPTPVSPEADAASVYASDVAMIRYIQSIGSKAFVGTLPQWGNATVGSYFNDYRLALNVLRRANSGRADGVVDIAVDMDPFDADNFCADMLHENSTCQEEIVAPRIISTVCAT